MNLGEYIEKLIDVQGRDRKWVASNIDVEYRTFLYRLKNNCLLADDLLKLKSILDFDLNKVYEDIINYEINNSTKIVNGIEINTKITDIYHFNVLEVEVGTNGFCGGKTSEGGRTYFRLKDCGSTDINANVSKNEFGDTEEVTIELGGDAELETFTQALEFAVKVLKEQAGR